MYKVTRIVHVDYIRLHARGQGAPGKSLPGRHRCIVKPIVISLWPVPVYNVGGSDLTSQ